MLAVLKAISHKINWNKVELFAMHIPKLEEKITVIKKPYKSISNKAFNLTILTMYNIL